MNHENGRLRDCWVLLFSILSLDKEKARIQITINDIKMIMKIKNSNNFIFLILFI